MRCRSGEINYKYGYIHKCMLAFAIVNNACDLLFCCCCFVCVVLVIVLVGCFVVVVFVCVCVFVCFLFVFLVGGWFVRCNNNTMIDLAWLQDI